MQVQLLLAELVEVQTEELLGEFVEDCVAGLAGDGEGAVLRRGVFVGVVREGGLVAEDVPLLEGEELGGGRGTGTGWSGAWREKTNSPSRTR